MSSGRPPLRSSRLRPPVRGRDDARISWTHALLEQHDGGISSPDTQPLLDGTTEVRAETSGSSPQGGEPSPDRERTANTSACETDDLAPPGRWLPGCSAGRDDQEWRITDTVIQAYLALKGERRPLENDLFAWIGSSGRYMVQPGSRLEGMGTCRT